MIWLHFKSFCYIYASTDIKLIYKNELDLNNVGYSDKNIFCSISITNILFIVIMGLYFLNDFFLFHNWVIL